ncbi:MAG: methyltransferase domain-containing protein [Pseudanabaena sp. M046S1SP1A06QC]|nr:methyltransferase domain-containing protein [Pseudanabaena sp. M046S1SP1A06QC]
MSIQSPLTYTDDITCLRVIAVDKLIKQWNHEFNIDITSELHGYKEIYLYQCNQTKLKFFFPLDIAGSDKLYEQLQKLNWFYMPDKWEHKVALKNLLNCNDILEIGCAFGSFVESALNLGLNAKGIELNLAAVEIAKSNNLPVESIDLEDFAKQYPLSQDAICSFQVLEHISEPSNFIKLCLQILKPNGKLILCVPNSQSFLKYQYNLLDMPPHHMTQWEISTFQSLENIFPLKLQQVIKEPLAEYHVNGYINTYTNHFFGTSALAKILFNRYTNKIYTYILKSGLRQFLTGQSLYVQFQKSDEIS